MKNLSYVFILIFLLVAGLVAGDQWGAKTIWNSAHIETWDADSGHTYNRTDPLKLNYLIATIPAKDFGKCWIRWNCSVAPTTDEDTIAIYFKTPSGTVLATDSIFGVTTTAKLFYIKVDTTTTRYIPEIIVTINAYLDSAFVADASYDYTMSLEYLWKP